MKNKDDTVDLHLKKLCLVQHKSRLKILDMH